MKFLGKILLFLLASLVACVTDPVELPPEADLTLDELADKTNYPDAMVIDCGYYKGVPVDKVLVNGLPPDHEGLLELLRAGYYRIEIFQGRAGQQPTDVIRIVILDPERGDTEWGLPPWTPVDPDFGYLGNEEPLLLYTPAVPAEVSVPLIVILEKELTRSDTYLQAEIAAKTFSIKRGVGSVQIPKNTRGINLRIDTRNIPVGLGTIQTPALQLSGELQEDTDIPPGSYIHVPEELIIPEGITLNIGSGCFIVVDQGVNIINKGSLAIMGSAGEPVTVTCSDDGAYWGGFIGKTSGNRLEASHAIFSRSGHNTGGEYAYGHAGRQALFYGENGILLLDHCYMIDHIGQIFYPLSCSLELTDCLVQRAKTGGQMNQSQLMMDRCIFTDFPDDSDEYRDADNDALYLDECNASISNSVFMYAKDDGLDSGASGGGEVLINNCWFEANYHEGAALSSARSVVKLHQIRNSTFINNGQGLELGYSSPNHQVVADSCTFYANGVGIRYGDCYEMAHQGYIHVKNSESRQNSYYDVWNMNREHWAADTFHMSFENVIVSVPNSMYPDLIVNE